MDFERKQRDPITVQRRSSYSFVLKSFEPLRSLRYRHFRNECGGQTY